MSSHIDYFDCPKCGKNAQREQDNRSGEVVFSCSNCDWIGENVEETDFSTVIFKCPECKKEGNHFIECVLDGTHHQTVSEIQEDGSVIYNHIESEAMVEKFQCENCGYVLKNEDGSRVDNEEELIQWLERNRK